MGKLFKVWRFVLPFLLLFVLIHFLKDITQDILKIQTPLDIFGDVKEDLSSLSPTDQNLYLYGLGGLSFIAEAFLLISIPILFRRKQISRLEKYVFVVSFFLLIFFLVATFLDPRYRLR